MTFRDQEELDTKVQELVNLPWPKRKRKRIITAAVGTSENHSLSSHQSTRAKQTIPSLPKPLLPSLSSQLLKVGNLGDETLVDGELRTDPKLLVGPNHCRWMTITMHWLAAASGLRRSLMTFNLIKTCLTIVPGGLAVVLLNRIDCQKFCLPIFLSIRRILYIIWAQPWWKFTLLDFWSSMSIGKKPKFFLFLEKNWRTSPLHLLLYLPNISNFATQMMYCMWHG